MASSVLKLFYLLNNPSEVDRSLRFVELDSLSPPTLLITDPRLAKSILKADEIRSFDLVSYWQSITQSADTLIEPVRNHFKHSPVLLHGQAHRSARKAVLPIYKSAEADLEGWIQDTTREFFQAGAQANEVLSASQFATAYITRVFRKMICNALSVQEKEFPALPGHLFSFFLRAHELLAYSNTLRALTKWIAENAPGHLAEQADGLLSITVMGREPMIGALTYGLIQRCDRDGQPWTGASLMDEASPVSELIGREVMQDISLEGIHFRQGQILHLSPFLLDKSPASSESRFTFGHGPHICLGRAIALRIAQAFVESLPVIAESKFIAPRFMRDNVLTFKEKKR